MSVLPLASQETRVKLFQLHYLDRDGAVILKRSHAARHDRDALTEAERVSRTHTVEVWEGGRKVARIKKGQVPHMIQGRWGGR